MQGMPHIMNKYVNLEYSVLCSQKIALEIHFLLHDNYVLKKNHSANPSYKAQTYHWVHLFLLLITQEHSRVGFATLSPRPLSVDRHRQTFSGIVEAQTNRRDAEEIPIDHDLNDHSKFHMFGISHLRPL